MYFGGKYTSTIRGTMRKDVECVNCHSDFYYEVQREATGTGHSPYYLNNKGAASQAEKIARRKLEKKLRKAIEPASCPFCGNYQPDMVRLLRRRQFVLLDVVGWFAIAIAGLRHLYGAPALHMLAVGVGLVLLSLVGRHYFYNPNARAAERARLQYNQPYSAPNGARQSFRLRLKEYFHRVGARFTSTIKPPIGPEGNVIDVGFTNQIIDAHFNPSTDTTELDSPIAPHAFDPKAPVALDQHDCVLDQKSVLDNNQKPPPIPEGANLPHNAPCPCGSGRQFKHCHGLNG